MPSLEVDATSRSSGENATLCTQPVFPDKIAKSLTAHGSQILTVRSSLPVARCRPSCEKVTQRTASPCPKSLVRIFPVATSHSPIAASVLAVASIVPVTVAHVAVVR